jgi:hypothetical protein
MVVNIRGAHLFLYSEVYSLMIAQPSTHVEISCGCLFNKNSRDALLKIISSLKYKVVGLMQYIQVMLSDRVKDYCLDDQWCDP